MEFGEILEEWERIKREREAERGSEARGSGRAAASSGDGRSDRRSPATKALEEWLDEKGVQDKDRGGEEAERKAERGRGADASRLAALRPQARIDLHGMGAEAAGAALEAFLADSARAGMEKVLVVHGKGLHSEGEPVLKKIVRRIVEASPWTGRFGPAARADGGSGAMWIALRRTVGREGD